MLVESRATQYVYDASTDRASVTIGSGGTKHAEARVMLLLDAKKSLVGIDLRGTPADCVVMLGQHEDVASQASADARVDLASDDSVTAVHVVGAGKAIANPAKNPYL